MLILSFCTEACLEYRECRKAPRQRDQNEAGPRLMSRLDLRRDVCARHAIALYRKKELENHFTKTAKRRQKDCERNQEINNSIRSEDQLYRPPTY